VQNDPRTRVSAPAVGLIVTGGLGAAIALLYVMLSAIGGLAALAGRDAARELPGVGVSMVMSVFWLAIAGFIIYAGLQMRQLNGWGLSMAGAIVAMIPCISPCCLLGLPIGIWAILVLIDDEVKRAFGAGGFGPPPGGYGPPDSGHNPPPGGYGPPSGGFGVPPSPPPGPSSPERPSGGFGPSGGTESPAGSSYHV